VLHDGDRIEIYRTLQIDAKQARRLRAGGKRAGRIPKAGGEA
jgi:putative ubiquitin-RnfH superfamily antitoxin RatB of RatAB toxin-antitoxin module